MSSKRLIEVATELNVGLKTVVDFLTGQGFEVSNKPTAKISPEMYEVLLRSFRNSIAIKEQADQIAQNTSRSTKKEEKSPKDQRIKPWERPTLNHKEPKSLVKPVAEEQPIESNPVVNPPVKEETPVVEDSSLNKNEEIKTTIPPTTEDQVSDNNSHTLKGPKILGKINLDAPVKKQPQQQQKNQQQQHKGNDKNQQHNRNDRNDRNGNNDHNKKQQQQQHNKNSDREKSQPIRNEQPAAEKKTIEQLPETVKKEPIVEVKKVEERVIPELPVIDEHRAETPQLQGLKILGKINIESTKKKKKKTPINNNPQRQPIGAKPFGSGAGKDATKTPGTEGEKEGANSDALKKKPRKKIQLKDRNTGTPNNNAPAKEGATSNSSGNNNSSGGGDKKNTSGNNSGNNNRNSNRPAGNNSNNNRNPKKKEITDKEVQESLKATMALMRSGKRKKTSGTRSERDERKERMRQQGDEEESNVLQVTEFISVSELANLMEASASEVITACMKAGIYVSINQRLDAEVIELICMEFGFEVAFVSAEDQMEAELLEEVDDPADLKPRAPIVTVMGHVDHGKTSLLDRIRKANVVAGEAGGITQHIGAYEVLVPNMGKITFLDTPGHEAFTAMRARGAKVTDIAVIIVAADDNVMPQTKEAISHAQAAGVPIIFAINKIDKEGASPERIKQELSGMGFLVEEWGGKYQSQEISAKKGLNIDLLLEKILLEAEILELKANPDRLAIATVLEASIEKGRGYVAKMLIQSGTLHEGDVMLAGQYYGRVKAMFNERGKRIKEAGPSAPVLVLGLQGAPQAGEKMKVMPDEREAKELASKRAQLIRQQQIRATRRITLKDINERLKVGNFRELNLIVKCDMDGSVEALSDALLKLSNQQVQTNIVYKAVGPISESDVNLAAASNAIIIGFQVRPNPMAKKLAEQEGVEIKTYSIIYDAIEEIKSALEGMLEPKQVEEELGLVEIQQVFNITKVGNIAGCLVQEGKVTRNSFVRVVRNGIVVFPKKEGVHGKLASLKRFKDNAMEVKAGTECGLSIEGFDDIKEGDLVEVYEVKEVKQTLESVRKDSANQQKQ